MAECLGIPVVPDSTLLSRNFVLRKARSPLPVRFHAIFCTDVGSLKLLCHAACGPDSFNLDVGNAVAECELAILRGVSACSEIYLHRETYRYALRSSVVRSVEFSDFILS